MNKIYLPIIVFIFLGLNSSPVALAADETDLYADSVYSAGNQTYKPENSLGTPDSVYTDFFDRDTAITLDMGEDEAGTGDLTLYFKIQDFGAAYRVEFLDVDLNKLQTSSDAFPLSVSEITIPYTESSSYRYVTITCVEEETWSLDAIMTSKIETTEEIQPVVEPTIEEAPITTSVESCGGNHGLLVKRVDDGSSITDADSIVYEIGCDGILHIIPNEATYKTWWTDFENISFIGSSFLVQHELGNNVTIRPGTYLVKQTSSPKVYAVESDGVLRWLPDEATAEALYGVNWNKIVIGLPEELFSDYTIGDDLTATAYPNEVIGYLPEGRVVYLSGTSYYNLPGDTINSLRLNSKFLVPLSATIMATYTDGGDLEFNSEISLPY